MKQLKQSSKNIIHHPSVFGISIFQSPQQLIAIYLALQNYHLEYRTGAAKFLEQLLHRTKSPPIALTYTKEFLLLTSESEIQLAIIRFVSQLSDLSAGKSMQTSLSFILDNSSFLTELRHNLTHRVMVKGFVIQRGKSMILQELKEKYWKIIISKVMSIYSIDSSKVEQIFAEICQITKSNEMSGQECRQDLVQIMKKCQFYSEYRQLIEDQDHHKLAKEYLFEACLSNYQFKNLLQPFILTKMLPSIVFQINSDENYLHQIQTINQCAQKYVSQYLPLKNMQQKNYFGVRCLILLSVLIQTLLKLHKYCQIGDIPKYRIILTSVTVQILKQISKTNQETKIGQKKSKICDILKAEIIMKKLRQIYLVKHVKEYCQIIEALPEGIVDSINKHWTITEQRLQKKILVEL